MDGTQEVAEFVYAVAISAGGGVGRDIADAGYLLEGAFLPEFQDHDFALFVRELLERLFQLLAEQLAVGIGATFEKVRGRLFRVVAPDLDSAHAVDGGMVDHAQ
jgi:hypothetical protein